MTPETAIKIITDEELYIRDYNWFKNREVEPGELGIIRHGNEWEIYVTAEGCGGIISLASYLDLSEALYYLVDRMRARKFTMEKLWKEQDENYKKKSEEIYLKIMRYRQEIIIKEKKPNGLHVKTAFMK